jgi:very-short-patch-repair endonuclease
MRVGSFALVSEQYPKDRSTLRMSSQGSDWRERLHSNPSRMEQELAIKLQDDGIHYQTQVEIPVTTADFYFPSDPRPLLVFVDGRVHLATVQMAKDEELRTLLRKKGYRVLELSYHSYSDRRRDELYEGIRACLGRSTS